MGNVVEEYFSRDITLPSWLNERAEKAGVNFSKVLQEGLKNRLGIQD